MNTREKRRRERTRWTFLLLFSLLFSSSALKNNKNETHLGGIHITEEIPQMVTIKPDALISKDDVKIDTVHIYLSPSVQTWNAYINQLGTEAQHMNKIAEIMYSMLKQYSFIQVDANLNYLSLANSVAESNQKSRDIHLALHSNAGGGSGLETFQKKSDGFGQYLHEQLMSSLPFPSRGVKDGNHLYEIKNAKAKHVVLMELLFHDNLQEAQYIVTHHEEIATKLTNALVNYIVDNYAKK